MDVPQEWLSREEMLAEKDADAFNDETFGDLGDNDGGWDDPGGAADGGWDDPVSPASCFVLSILGSEQRHPL